MNASSFDQILRKVVIVPVFALLLGALLLAWQIRTADATVAVIEEDDIRLRDTLIVEKLVIDEEGGLRGYEITHDPRFLARYNEASQALPAAFAARRALVGSNARRQAVDQIRMAHETWEQSFAEPLISTIQAGGATNDITLNLHGKERIDEIRKSIEDLNILTEQARARAIAQWRWQQRTIIGAIIAFAILIGLIIGFYVRSLLEQVSEAFRQSHNALRIRAEQTFRSEERLRTILESIGEGVITCDSQGRVQSMNQSAQTLTGWSETDARSLPLEEVFALFDQTTHLPHLSPAARAAETNQRVALENQALLRRPDGSELIIENSASPIRDKQSDLAGLVIVFRDVTLQKKSQAALLANEKLAVAGRLAASIAHEIHNPLDSVSNLLYLLNTVSSEQEREHFLKLANQEIARVTHISRAMLSLYRESRTPVTVDIGEMLASVLLLTEGKFRALQVKSTCDLPEHLCVEGFPAELRQVFTNLLTNAAEACRSGEGRVHVQAQGLPIAGRGARNAEPGVLVTIADNGPGIPDDVLGSLFQPFFTTKGEQGTGLGLWISRGIVAKHGGTLNLQSSTEQDRHGTMASVFLATHPTITIGPQ